MDFMLRSVFPPAPQQISHREKILTIGSCFTEHIGSALAKLKFSVLQNPSGILFDPGSLSSSLVSYMNNQPVQVCDLFQLGEIWSSWNHHGQFSGTHAEAVIAQINQSQESAHHFLKEASWLVITLGSSYSYQLLTPAPGFSPINKRGVANCHRAPAQWFHKHMMSVEESTAALDNALHQLFTFNPYLKVIFTVSPVRHIRDGVINNNRSKGRLLESVHLLVEKFERLYYFPSYEIVIDILRDYRFYSEDMVHPNYLSTDYVLEEFQKMFMSEETRELLLKIREVNQARRHLPVHPNTIAHQNFLISNAAKIAVLQKKYPFIDFIEEANYFSIAPLL